MLSLGPSGTPLNGHVQGTHNSPNALSDFIVMLDSAGEGACCFRGSPELYSSSNPFCIKKKKQCPVSC